MSQRPAITKMASGNLSLLITEDVSWDSFPTQAQIFVNRVKAIVLKKIDSPVERMWVVLINWRPFFLTFDDYPLGLSLDSMSFICNGTVKKIHKELTSEHT